MRYDRRVKLIHEEEVKIPTGYETITNEKIIPCNQQPLSVEEQIALYGGYMQEALKLHLLTLPLQTDKVFYTPKGEEVEKEYDIKLIRNFGKRAVLYLEEVT